MGLLNMMLATDKSFKQVPNHTKTNTQNKAKPLFLPIFGS